MIQASWSPATSVKLTWEATTDGGWAVGAVSYVHSRDLYGLYRVDAAFFSDCYRQQSRIPGLHGAADSYSNNTLSSTYANAAVPGLFKFDGTYTDNAMRIMVISVISTLVPSQAASALRPVEGATTDAPTVLRAS